MIYPFEALMKSIRIVLLIVAAMTWLLALPVLAVEADAGVKVVIVQGTGAGDDKAKARDDALADAQRRAVEQGVGLYIKSETVVVNFELISDTIYRDVRGYVHTYRVLQENYNTAEELYWVKIEATVRTGKIEKDLDDLYERLRVAGNPRIVVAIDQKAGSAPAELAQDNITEQLLDLGFKVLDATQLSIARERQALRMLVDGRIDAVTAMALQDCADIIIVGTATARQPEVVAGGGGAYSCQSTLDVKAISTDTGRIISAARGKAVGAGFSAESAEETALENAGKSWVKENLGKLVRAVVDPCKEISLNVTGCTHAQVTALEAALADSRFVRQVDLLAFDKGYAQLRVQYQGTVKMLGKDAAAIKGLRIEVESITANTIRAHIKR
ncbi:MAG: hypothetical protein ACYDCO_02375 [Armatimonadota bacterium]